MRRSRRLERLRNSFSVFQGVSSCTFCFSLPSMPDTGSNFWRLVPLVRSPGFSPGSLSSNLPMDAVDTPACLEACLICNPAQQIVDKDCRMQLCAQAHTIVLQQETFGNGQPVLLMSNFMPVPNTSRLQRKTIGNDASSAATGRCAHRPASPCAWWAFLSHGLAGRRPA